MEFKSLLAGRVSGLKPSPIRKLVPIMRKPGMISFGGGYPNAQTFAFTSVDVVFKSGRRFSIRDKAVDLACQYGPTDAGTDLKPLILQWHADKDGVALKADQLQVVTGAQEGLHIMAYLFLDREDSVIMAEPTYSGTLGAFRAFTERFVPVPLDGKGMVTEALEKTLANMASAGQRLPKFIYDIPNGHNPAGVSLSLERRKHLLQIASRYNLLILEDDPYQLLQLEEGELLPTLQALDQEGRVIRLDSFSKIFAPGLRLGYASGPAEVIGYFQLYKQGLNLHTSAMDQALLAGFLGSHSHAEFRAIIKDNIALYRRNRDAVLAAARKYLPPDIRYNVPPAGLFIWFEMPAGFDAERMVETDGMELGVLMVPGIGFSMVGGLSNYMLASFSMVNLEQVEEGMIRFARMIERERGRVG